MEDLVCPKCDSDYITLQNYGYFCSDCEYEFIIDGDTIKEAASLTEYKKLIELHNRRENDMILSPTLENLLAIYAPEHRFLKEFAAVGFTSYIHLRHSLSITYDLMTNKNYHSALNIETYPMSADEKEYYFTESATEFLSTRNHLRFFPIAKEWSEYINAPIDITERLIKEFKVPCKLFFPNLKDNDFAIILRKRFLEILPEYQSISWSRSLTTLAEFEQYFINIVQNDYHCLDLKTSTFLRQKLFKEIQIVRNYENDIKNMLYGSFDMFYKIAKDNNLSNQEFSDYVMTYYFRELFN